LAEPFVGGIVGGAVTEGGGVMAGRVKGDGREGNVGYRRRTFILRRQRSCLGGGLSGLEEGLLLGFEVTVDTDVGVLIETGIGFEAGFGSVTTFDYTVVMTEETHAPFKGCVGVVMFQGMGIALGLFDEFAISNTGGRPVRREMVSIALEVTITVLTMSEDNMFAVMLTFFGSIHGTP